jgi:hypothetical protein
MAETNDSLSHSFAIAVLAKREAVKAVKADMQARGVRLSYVSPRDVRMAADDPELLAAAPAIAENAFALSAMRQQ